MAAQSGERISNPRRGLNGQLLATYPDVSSRDRSADIARAIPFPGDRRTRRNRCRSRRALRVLLMAMLTIGANVVCAQEIEVGKNEYTRLCAACHGIKGKVTALLLRLSKIGQQT